MEVSPALWEYLRPCALVAPPSAEEGGGATAFRLAPPLRQVSSPPFGRCAVGWGWGGRPRRRYEDQTGAGNLQLSVQCRSGRNIKAGTPLQAKPLCKPLWNFCGTSSVWFSLSLAVPLTSDSIKL